MNSQKKVTDYRIVSVGSPQSVDGVVSATSVSEVVWMEGWQPWGSPFAISNRMYQAFVKYEN